jgi:hypothetical protein
MSDLLANIQPCARDESLGQAEGRVVTFFCHVLVPVNIDMSILTGTKTILTGTKTWPFPDLRGIFFSCDNDF